MLYFNFVKCFFTVIRGCDNIALDKINIRVYNGYREHPGGLYIYTIGKRINTSRVFLGILLGDIVITVEYIS